MCMAAQTTLKDVAMYIHKAWQKRQSWELFYLLRRLRLDVTISDGGNAPIICNGNQLVCLQPLSSVDILRSNRVGHDDSSSQSVLLIIVASSAISGIGKVFLIEKA